MGDRNGGVKLEEANPLIESAAGNQGKQDALQVTEDARKDYEFPSFGSQLFMGTFAPELMHPFPLQDEEDKKIGDEYIAKVMEFLKANLDPEEVDASREIPQKVIDGLFKLGAFAMKIPKKYGGLGLSKTNYNRVIMNVASFCGSTAVLLSAHQSIGVPQPLLMYGTEEQRQKYFPKFSEHSISAFALTEPDVGSDPAQMSTIAKLSDDGKYYTLNGTKLWCTNGTKADVIIVMAKTAPKIVKGVEKPQISAFILDMNTPGVEVAHRCEFMGLGGIYNGVLKFKDVKVPAENLLWGEGRGLALALGTINVGRLTLPAACTGAAKMCLKIVRRWGKERVQWGQPIGLHEPGRQKIAYIAATTFAMEAMAWLTSAWADSEKVDIRIEAAMAKLFCTEELWKIVDMTMQLRGGRGYEKGRSLKARGEVPYPVERMMRDCRINTILEGTSEIMRLFLFREALDPHLKLAGPLLSKRSSMSDKMKAIGKMAGFYTTWVPKQLFATTGSFKEMGELSKHYAFIESTAHTMAYTIFKAMAKYKAKLEYKQLLLGRLMDTATELFAMAATCSYAIALNKQNPQDKSPIELADHFCMLAKRRINQNFKALESNDDKISNQLAEKVIDKRYQWLEEGIDNIGPED